MSSYVGRSIIGERECLPYNQIEPTAVRSSSIETSKPKKPHISRLVSLSLKIDRRTYAGQMAERLRGVTHLFPGYGHFFREHAQMIRVRENVVVVRDSNFVEVWNGSVVF